MRDDIISIRIRVRNSGGTYTARVLAPGPKSQASCTSSAEQAAMVCANKVLMPEAVQVDKLATGDHLVSEFLYSGFRRQPKSERSALLEEQALIGARLDEINAALAL